MKRVVSVLMATILTFALFPAHTAVAAERFTPVTGQEMMERLEVGLNLWEIFTCDMPKIQELQSLDYEFYNDYYKSTPEYFKAIAKKGFNFVRFQVSWEAQMNEDYQIDEEWLNRVEEVVNYALDAGLYVIISPFIGPEGGPNITLEYKKCNVYLTAVWTQVSECFSDYSERVIFDVMNEPASAEFTESDAAIVNKLNTDCLELIRQSGGNNAKRIVLLPSVGASVGRYWLERYEFPDDPYCMASVHSYAPYSFGLEEESESTATAVFSADGQKEVFEMFDLLNEFLISANIPFVMGETGAVDRNNINERIKWVNTFIGEAKKAGIPCGIHSDGGGFSVIDHRTLAWTDLEYINAILTAYGKTPGANYVFNTVYNTTHDVDINRMLDHKDGWRTIDETHGILPQYEFEKADAVVFECTSDVLKTWGNNFMLQYVTEAGWVGETTFNYPESKRITVSGNKVIFDKRGLAPAIHIGMGGGRSDWYDTLKRIYLEKNFDPTYSAWALPYLQTAYANDLIPGALMESFTVNTTRGEFMSMLVPTLEKALGKIDYSGVTAPDSTNTDVLKCKKLGILTGVDDKGTIQPNRALTRQEAALMLTRALRVLGYDDKAVDITYADAAQIDTWALDGVKNMKGYGIMVGGDGGFMPKESYTREACITTVTRLFETIADN